MSAVGLLLALVGVLALLGAVMMVVAVARAPEGRETRQGFELDAPVDSTAKG